jgi:hypothetical protein
MKAEFFRFDSFRLLPTIGKITGVNESGSTTSEIYFVESSASMFSTSSLLVILSRRFSFFSPLCCLYSFAVLSAHVFKIVQARAAGKSCIGK